MESALGKSGPGIPAAARDKGRPSHPQSSSPRAAPAGVTLVGSRRTKHLALQIHRTHTYSKHNPAPAKDLPSPYSPIQVTQRRRVICLPGCGFVSDGSARLRAAGGKAILLLLIIFLLHFFSTAKALHSVPKLAAVGFGPWQPKRRLLFDSQSLRPRPSGERQRTTHPPRRP
jgi:hypothetical protein